MRPHLRIQFMPQISKVPTQTGQRVPQCGAVTGLRGLSAAGPGSAALYMQLELIRNIFAPFFPV